MKQRGAQLIDLRLTCACATKEGIEHVMISFWFCVPKMSITLPLYVNAKREFVNL